MPISFFGSKKLNNDLSSSTSKIITTQMKSAKSELDNNQQISSDEAASNSESNDSNNNNMKNKQTIAEDFDELIKKKQFKQRQMCKRYVLLCVSIALLLDGMLNMVIIPIVPEFLRLLKLQSESYLNKLASDFVSNDSNNQTFSTQSDVHQVQNGDKFNYSKNDILIGFLFATKPFIQLLVNPFSGTLIDHIGCDIPMITGLLIGFASTMIFAYTSSFSLLFVARGLQGVGSALADTSGFAMIAHSFKEHQERTKALGIVITSLALGSFMSVPFSGVLFEFAGKRVPFIVLAFIALFDAFLFVLNWQAKCSMPALREVDKIVEIKKKTPIWRLLMDPYIAICSVSIIMANVPLAFTEPTIAVWMKETMNSTESEIGFIWLCGFVPHISAVFISIQLIKRFAKYQWLFLMIGLFIEAVSCAFIPFITNYFILIIPICIITFGYGLIDSTILPTVAYLVDTRHASEYGTVYSIVDISYSGFLNNYVIIFNLF